MVVVFHGIICSHIARCPGFTTAHIDVHGVWQRSGFDASALRWLVCILLDGWERCSHLSDFVDWVDCSGFPAACNIVRHDARDVNRSRNAESS